VERSLWQWFEYHRKKGRVIWRQKNASQDKSGSNKNTPWNANRQQEGRGFRIRYKDGRQKARSNREDGVQTNGSQTQTVPRRTEVQTAREVRSVRGSQPQTRRTAQLGVVGIRSHAKPTDKNSPLNLKKSRLMQPAETAFHPQCAIRNAQCAMFYFPISNFLSVTSSWNTSSRSPI
jgi:hypothetical protein